jgi:hypothetical protein
MNEPYTGGCACGAIRYEVSAEPVVMSDCQCRQCHRDSGTGHGSHLTFSGGGRFVAGQRGRWSGLMGKKHETVSS